MSDRPNIIVICVDQMQAACLSCAEHSDVQTPNLDRLAAEGVRFERAYCENPICTPSRISLMTGLSSRQHGVLGNGRLVPHTIPTMASVLREAGYRTQACGKLHLQPWNLGQNQWARPGQEQEQLWSWEDRKCWQDGTIQAIPEGYFGFESCDFLSGHVDYIEGDYIRWLQDRAPQWACPPEGLVRPGWRRDYGREVLHPGHIGSCFRMTLPAELHYNTWITDRSIDFLRSEGKNRPFFLWVSFPDPHHPYAAAEPYCDRYVPEELTLPETWQKRVDDDCGLNAIPHHIHGFKHEKFNESGLRCILAQSYGMISHIDDCVGRLLNNLSEMDMDRNTIVVFLADHGEYLGAHHLLAKGNFPFEQILRVPMIWRDPLDVRPGRTCSDLVSLLDVAPTILDRAGLSMERLRPQPQQESRGPYPCFDGMSLRSHICEGTQLPQRCFLASREDHYAHWSPEYRPGLLRIRCFYRGPWKLIVSNQQDIHALYHLGQDPEELHDRWNDPDCLEIRSELLEEYCFFALDREWIGLGRVGPA